jgi:hypothetical protein
MRGKRRAVGRVRERERRAEQSRWERQRAREREREIKFEGQYVHQDSTTHTVAMNILLLFLHVLLSDATQQKTFFSLGCMNVFSNQNYKNVTWKFFQSMTFGLCQCLVPTCAFFGFSLVPSWAVFVCWSVNSLWCNGHLINSPGGILFESHT